MSLASGFIPAGSLIYGCLFNGGFYERTGFKKYGFFYKNNFLPPSGARFVTNQKLRLSTSSQIHRLCKWRGGFNHVAASHCAASSFNDSVGDFKDCGRAESENKGARNGDGSDTSTGYGHGNGNSGGNHRGGGDNGGSGSGGLGEGADWEELRWFCWQLLKAWKYFNSLAKLGSFVVSGFGNIHFNIEGLKIEANLDGLVLALEPLLLAICGVLLLPCLFIAVAFCATIFAGVLLFGCVVALAALIWFWWSDMP